MSLNVTSNIGVIGYNNTNTSKNGFVAVAGTSEYSAYSTDGINWTDFKISDSMNIYWSSISYGNGIYVAFPSASKYYAYSYDGINWTETQFTNVSITGKVCFGNEKFVVCSATSNAASNTFAIYSSTDGINWTTATDISQLSYEFLEKYTEFFIDGDVTRLYPCYGNGKFVAVTDNYSLSIYSTDGLTWTRVVINESTNIKFRAICYGNGKFVAVAYNTNYFVYSSDGITWTTGRLPSSRDWYSVCYGNGKFVTIAYNSNAFAYSTDGINWTEGTISSTSRNWYSVCYGDGKFIAIASDTNYFAYSTDGITWTESTISSTSRSWDSVCFGVINASINTPEKAFNLSQPENASTTEFEDKVILDSIVHHDSPMYLLINQKATNNNFYIHSPVLGDITLTGSDRKIYPVDLNMNRNCIGGKLHPLGNGYVAYSVYSNNMSDTTPTSKQSDTDTGSLELITGVIKANPYLGYYKAVNGINFYGIDNDVDEFMKPYREMPGKFIVVDSIPNRVYNNNTFAYSTDGITWTNSTFPSSRYWISVCYGNGKFVALAYDSNYFAYSTDGINWTEGTISSSSRYWMSVCYGNGMFVAVADSTNYFAYSSDGINWTEGAFPNRGYWESVCYGNGKFVIVGNSNYFAYSSDGITWTLSTISSTSRWWHSVCYGNGKFVAVNSTSSGSNTFAYSTDGITWTEGTLPSSREWQSVCYGNGKFVTVATNTNYFAYSTDGITWTEGMISDTSRYWQSVCYGNGKFVAIARNSNYFAYSTDGINWIVKNTYMTVHGFICYGAPSNIEFSNNHTGISSDVTDINGVSTMTTYTEQYSDDIYYIHYAWVDRASSSLVRYNILTRKIDTSSGTPVISNVASCATTFSIGTVAHPSFHKDKNGIHCAFYHGNTTYTKYYKLTRSGTDDSTWSWGVDSNTYITNENISLMVNKNENNLQSSLAQSARRMYMVNSSDNLVEFKKTQTF